jgi:hypothetical protein
MKDGTTLRIKKNAWDSLVIQEGLEGCYFDKMDVYKLPNMNDDDHNTTLRYSGYWIGLGDNDLFTGLEGKHPNPSSQFLVYKQPPRITSKRSTHCRLDQLLR